ncbi:MAG: hypothetical protein R3C27_13825, partial [Hyphomonadaceae bacterium]
RKSMERNVVHGAIGATYTPFEANGEKYLQIDTYGSDARDIPGKKSQSVQLNKQSAIELVAILRREFDI